MNNKEIKKKIVDVAISQVWTDSFGDEIVIDREAAGAFADALIAAGIGDVKEAEHRAEVYYEALLSAAAYGDTPPDHYIEQAEKELAEEENNGN